MFKKISSSIQKAWSIIPIDYGKRYVIPTLTVFIISYLITGTAQGGAFWCWESSHVIFFLLNAFNFLAVNSIQQNFYKSIKKVNGWKKSLSILVVVIVVFFAVTIWLGEFFNWHSFMSHTSLSYAITAIGFILPTLILTFIDKKEEEKKSKEEDTQLKAKDAKIAELELKLLKIKPTAKNLRKENKKTKKK